MLFTAYLDESNTGSQEPDITVAGYLGSGPQLRIVERKLRELKRSQGFRSFHATRFKAKQDDFKGWSDAKCSALIGSLARLVRDELTEAVTISLPYKQYVMEYRDTDFSKGVPKFSQYGLCIFTALDRLINVVRAKPGKNKLNLVVEDGHRNAGSAFTVFAEMRKLLGPDRAEILGRPKVVAKDSCELLMMADFQAHASGISDTWERSGRPGYVDMAGIRAPGAGEAAITFMKYRPGTLGKVKDAFVRLNEEKRAAYQQRKAAREAERGPSSSGNSGE